jgi:hypothetical protein
MRLLGLLFLSSPALAAPLHVPTALHSPASTLLGQAVAPTSPAAQAAPARTSVHPNPDTMATQLARALPKDTSALATFALLDSLRDRSPYAKVDTLLAAAAATTSGLPAETAFEALRIARANAPTVFANRAADARDLGIVVQWSVVGPFRDTGKGLDRLDGPEANIADYSNRSKRYDWGTNWVFAREVSASAEGFDLDARIAPRAETCSLLATEFDSAAQVLGVRIASSGQVRARIDGVEVARSEEMHADAMFDRVAAKVSVNPGKHLLEVKVCGGALENSGVVRARFTKESGEPLALVHSAPSAKSYAGLKGKPERVETPLETCLASKTPLVSALVRTLGGADDMQSPKATGILQELTKTSRDAEELALAGTISPSGGNRTSYLNRVEGSETVRAYRDRRLVQERIAADLADWAMATSLGMGLDKRTELDDVRLFADVRLAMRSDLLQSQAYRALKQAVLAVGVEQASDRAVADLRNFTFTIDRPLWLRMQNELYRRGKGRSTQITADIETGTVAQAEAHTLQALTESRYELGETMGALRLLSAVGAAPTAFEAAARAFPNQADMFAELAAAYTRAGKPQEHDVALKRARELDPGNTRIRAELKLRTQTTVQRDEKYLRPAAQFLARRLSPTAAMPTDVADRQLHWMRVVTMHPDMRVSQLIHYSREVVIAPRTPEDLYENLPLEGDLADILRARVHRRNGSTGFPVEEHNDGHRPRVRWPMLSPGDVVEVAVRTWTRNAIGGRGDAPFYFVDYAGSPSTHPLLYNEVIVDTPVDHPIYVDVVRGGAFNRSETKEGDRNVLKLVWDAPPNIPEEPLAPELSETAPLIMGSTYKTWDDFRAWYEEAVRGFTEPDAEVRALAASLTKKETTRDGKLRAIFNFVADDIRYVNFVSGEWWLPNRPQQVLTRREGDCDDKAILLIALLRAVGIQAEEVLVQTRLTGMPSLLQAPGVAIPRFDHGIAFMPGPNGGTYLDATSPESRMGPLPSMDARGFALPLSKVQPGRTSSIVQLPRSSAKEHGSFSQWSIALDKDGGGELRSKEKHIGDTAFWLRTSMRQAEARQQVVLDSLLGGWFSNLTLDKDITFEGDGKDGEAQLSYKAKSLGGFARFDAGSLVFELRTRSTLASKYAALPKRTLPVVLPPHVAPSTETHVVTVDAPAGFRLASPAYEESVSGGAFGNVHVKVARISDTRASIERTITFEANEIPVKDYEAFRAWLVKADSALRRGLRFSGAP